jgi:Putative auto-transporter adhesin, head GIN domain
MKKLLVLLLLSALVTGIVISMTGCSGTFGSPVIGNGLVQTKAYNNVGFDKIEIDNAFQADVNYANVFAVNITMDSNLFEYLDIEQLGSTLHIGLQKNHSYFDTTQKATITLPDLRGISVSGASKANINQFNSNNDMNISVSGAGRLDCTDIKAGNTQIEVSGAGQTNGTLSMAGGNFDISGASTLQIQGNTTNITAHISGASSGKLDNLMVVTANMQVSGASNATVNVSTGIDANVSGASRLYYIGSPTLGNINVTGASTFTKKP